METLRAVGPAFLALVIVAVIDVMTRRRGLDPPGFSSDFGGALRRATVAVVLFGVLWIGVFSPLGTIGLGQQPDLDTLTTPQLFLLHSMFLFAVVVWYALGFLGLPRRPFGHATSWRRQLGLSTSDIKREVGLGLILGLGAWLVVVAALLSIGVLMWWLGGEELLPKEPPAIIPWIAALPVVVRILVSLSAGVFEELFFRGYLQPRIGILLSSALFILAHASYEQPLMLVGVTLLSFIYAGLVRWRQNIWPAIAAHFVFDVIQLVVMIPMALKFVGEGLEQNLLPVADLGYILRSVGLF